MERIRGVKSDHAVNRLVEFGLIEEVGRLEAPGRPMLFATTEEFLYRFGVNSLKDLPALPEEVEKLLKEEVTEELKDGFGLEPDESGATDEKTAEEEIGETAGEEIREEQKEVFEEELKNSTKEEPEEEANAESPET